VAKNEEHQMYQSAAHERWVQVGLYRRDISGAGVSPGRVVLPPTQHPGAGA
jgi:hypothetical protein